MTEPMEMPFTVTRRRYFQIDLDTCDNQSWLLLLVIGLGLGLGLVDICLHGGCCLRVWQLCSPVGWRRGVVGTQPDDDGSPSGKHQRRSTRSATSPANQRQRRWPSTSRGRSQRHWPDPVRPNQTWTLQRTDTCRWRQRPSTSSLRHCVCVCVCVLGPVWRCSD